MSDLVGNPEDRFSHNEAHLLHSSGEKFAFGHMYVRPHETFHEPSRKFYPNEVGKAQK